MNSKNVVDDYYASIPSSDSNTSNVSASAKPKIKAKKKIVIKKVADKKEEINNETPTETKKSDTVPLKPIKTKKIVQKIEVVKRESI
jgi:hypothetical protein